MARLQSEVLNRRWFGAESDPKSKLYCSLAIPKGVFDLETPKYIYRLYSIQICLYTLYQERLIGRSLKKVKFAPQTNDGLICKLFVWVSEKLKPSHAIVYIVARQSVYFSGRFFLLTEQHKDLSIKYPLVSICLNLPTNIH